MDVVVLMAVVILGIVFCMSSAVLFYLCKRRYEYKRLLMSEQLRFSKLSQDNVDDIIRLSPHISEALSSNQWVYDVSGILEHCVAVLKLSHTLTDKLAKIPLTSISPQLNDVICQATSRVVPRFDDLLKSMAAPNVDVRLIEARVIALVTTCFSLVAPFYLINPKYKEVFGTLIREMEVHQHCLSLAVEQAQENVQAARAGVEPKQANVNVSHHGHGVVNGNGTPRSRLPQQSHPSKPSEGHNNVRKTISPSVVIVKSPTPAPIPAQQQGPPPQQQQPVAIANRAPAPQAEAIVAPVAARPVNRANVNGNVMLPQRPPAAAPEERRELLSDEAPADPSV
uniref:Transmembrane protein 98 n=1 Tax=Panagrellus redivivus TaxID=6233 RepID=A0A7E4ZQP5_PANRE